ncbi:hypothetical protein BG004_002431 [Podila humilis]|nr:hypothetical protein BG004_002431 [Podila humilis]
MAPHHERTLAVVIGAGVVGLTTAHLLQCNGYDVTIIAADFPKDPRSPDYASTKAGAHWRSMCDEDDLRAQEYDRVSYRTFEELAKEPESGVNIRRAVDYFDHNPTGKNDGLPWWSSVVKEFEQISGTAEFPIAYAYQTPVITPAVYLHFLMQQFQKAGGKFQHRQLTHIVEAAMWVGTKPKPIKVIVNCTGHKARTLGGVNDQRCYQTRGQTAIVRASWIHETITWISKSGHIMYIIPRSNGEVVLGGSHEPHQASTAVSGTKTTHILKTLIERYPKVLPPGSTAAYAANPDLMSKFDIVEQKIGFRPSRIGGVRVEVERGYTGYGEQVLIAHNYGHGGAGFQSSWGTAYDLIRLIEQARKDSAELAVYLIRWRRHIQIELSNWAKSLVSSMVS